ncbi:MAG: pentapeptide repeat-containing protein [Oscillatoriales cyanobacterium RM2_1_1]|nr:pentapeptide repeat-containing protein [Oscillatoriales cyanobacterium SM2_3_0]NJO46705.1 pentapeptide repeat-containing protein [Oscillatoriales cyanobacterium RM2_1_1]
MKSQQVLQLYENGRKDFRGQNLRGQSFRGKDLAGADFSYAEIQGANFATAILKGTQFKGAKAGLQKRWMAILFVLAGMLSVLLGLGLVLVCYCILLIFSISSPEEANRGWITLALAITFLFIAWRRSQEGHFGPFLSLIEIALVGLTVGIATNFDQVLALLGNIAISAVLAGFAGAIGFASAVAFAVVFAVVEEFAMLISVIRAIAMGAIAGGITAYLSGENVTLAIALAIGITLLFDALGWRAIRNQGKDGLIRNLAVNLAAVGGTSFRRADLTDADFAGAILKSVDFRQATLTRTGWRRARQLNRVRSGTTYLQNFQVRTLLEKGQGQNLNLDRQDLRGINLQQVNLTNASLIEANLSAANLRKANLAGAKLIRTRLSQANLSGATLTGAYIEDWGITATTYLDGVKCDYIFLRLPLENSLDSNPYRQPEDWDKVFKPGEFAELVQSTLQSRRWSLYSRDLLWEQSPAPAQYTLDPRVSPDLTQTDLPYTDLTQITENLERVILQIEEVYPTRTISEQMRAAAEVIRQMEQTPELERQMVNALLSGNLTIFERAIAHPMGYFVIAALQSWQDLVSDSQLKDLNED